MTDFGAKRLVYKKCLYRTVVKRKMSQFIEDLLKPLVLDTSLDEGYKAMASDTLREAQATEWCNALSDDAAHITW